MKFFKGIFWGLILSALIWAMIFIIFAGIDRTQKDRESVKHVEHPINARLLERMAFIESSNNPKAVSKKGAIGLYQVRYSVWKHDLKKAGIIKSKQCLYDPEKNREAALYILHKYHNQTGDIRKTLAKYSGNARGYAEKVLGEQ